MSRRAKIKNTHCSNCDYKFREIENFCPNCGQDNHSHKISLKHYFIEFLESTIHFDTKVFQTFKLLLFKPGKLTKDYNNNIRARYVPPIRLYIFISFVFFGLMAILPKNYQDLKINGKNIKNGSDPIEINLPAFRGMDLDKLSKLNLNEERLDSIILVSGHEPSSFNRFWYKGFIENTLQNKLTVDELRHKVFKTISILMFILMPIFALYLLLFNYRKKMYYVEHLNFAIHFHSLIFIILLTYELIEKLIFPTIKLFPIVGIGLFMYLILSQKSVYSLSWGKAIIKTSLLSLLYLFTLLILFLFSILISLV